MTALALGVIDDLRARKLWPVALLMALALIAAPVLLLEPAEELPPATSSAAAAPAPGGLPSPQDALGEGGKPLVSLAVLSTSSDLDTFASKNPFKPLVPLGSDSFAAPQLADGGTSTTAATGGGGSGADDLGGGGGGFDTGGLSPSLPGAPTPQPAPQPAPQPTPHERFTYTVDLSFETAAGTRRFRNLPKLRMLPDEAAPLLVFLGVDATGNDAVFLVDATLQLGAGEGRCSPSREACATVALSPGERQTFVDETGARYVIQIDQIREAALSTVARAAEMARAAVGATGADEVVRQFIPPVLTDLLVTGGQP